MLCVLTVVLSVALGLTACLSVEDTVHVTHGTEGSTSWDRIADYYDLDLPPSATSIQWVEMLDIDSNQVWLRIDLNEQDVHSFLTRYDLTKARMRRPKTPTRNFKALPSGSGAAKYLPPASLRWVAHGTSSAVAAGYVGSGRGYYFDIAVNDIEAPFSTVFVHLKQT